jgi:hypothetical protein
MYGLDLLRAELPSNEKAAYETLKNIAVRKYDDALKVANEAQATIAEYKASIAEDGKKNDCFIYAGFFELLISLASYWKCVESEKYHTSWCKLQDAIDCLRQLRRFYKEDSATLWYLTRQLLSIEKAYPYKLFTSCGFIFDGFECSICSQDIDSDECPHIKGNLYAGEMAVAIAKNLKELEHVSLVRKPKNKRLTVGYEDASPHFNLFRILIAEFDKNKCSPLNLAQVQLVETIRVDPDHKRAPRNSQCYCESGKKYKNCCIKSERMPHIHMRISPEAFIDSGFK